MRKERIKQKVCYLAGFLILGLILYSCLQDESDWGSDTTDKFVKGKNRELTVDVAQKWYEANQTPVVITRSVATNAELMTKLHWKKAIECSRGRLEVVEIPLLAKGGAVLMDKETMEKSYTESVRGKIRNISRMVIIKNLKTGQTINFVMHIVGTFDYLMTAKHFEDNSYLYRDPHLSGSIYFYKPEGGLVNGWRYENGKIIARISQGTEEGFRLQSATSTRTTESICYDDHVYMEENICTPYTYQDPEFGLSFGILCYKVGHWETVHVCKEIDTNNDEEDPIYPWNPSTGGGGGGGGGYTPTEEDPPITPVDYATKLNSMLPTLKSELQRLGAKTEGITIKFREGCASNCEVPAGTKTIDVCYKFFIFYTIRDQTSILWHECFHLESGHNIASKRINYIDFLYDRIPAQLKADFDEMIEWRVSIVYPNLTGEAKNNQIKWEQEDFTNIYTLSQPQTYKNEIATYASERQIVGGVSRYYEIERHFMQWKYHELLRLSEIFNNN